MLVIGNWDNFSLKRQLKRSSTARRAVRGIRRVTAGRSDSQTPRNEGQRNRTPAVQEPKSQAGKLPVPRHQAPRVAEGVSETPTPSSMVRSRNTSSLARQRYSSNLPFVCRRWRVDLVPSRDVESKELLIALSEETLNAAGQEPSTSEWKYSQSLQRYFIYLPKMKAGTRFKAPALKFEGGITGLEVDIINWGTTDRADDIPIEELTIFGALRNPSDGSLLKVEEA